MSQNNNPPAYSPIFKQAMGLMDTGGYSPYTPTQPSLLDGNGPMRSNIPGTPGAPVVPAADQQNWFGNAWDSLTGGSGEKGQGASALMQGAQTIAGLGQMYTGLKQYGLAERGFEETKRQFEMNWDAQRRLVNGQVNDQMLARAAASPGRVDVSPEAMNKRLIPTQQMVG